MTVEERIEITWNFLQALDSVGLLGKINRKLLHDEFTQNFPLSAESAGRVFNTIIEQHEDGVIDLKASYEEMMMFVGTFGVNLMNSYLEYVKKLLKIPIDRTKIHYDDKMMYGQLINAICSKLNWDETKNEIIRQNFFVDFRNAISHVDYYVTGNGVSFKIKNKKVHLDLEQFTMMVNEIKAVIDTMQKFIINKTSELEKKADELDNKIEEINQQTLQLQKEHLERKKNTLELKHEKKNVVSLTKRTERKRDKIYKNTKIIQRAKKRDARNTARIISKL